MPVDTVSSADAKAGGGNPLNLFADHPKGLPVLFFTEMWERFSYYGMRALLVLYMVAPTAQGGLGFSNATAASIYGTYTMLVYLTAIPGGYIADKFLGQRLSIAIGGVIIALGHFTLAIPNLQTFYTGLGLIIIGTGFLKPNMSTLLGMLYPPNDHRRDSGFSIYYMGINIGATLAPIICGFLAQSDEFRHFLGSNHLDPNSSWHWGFAAAGVGMLFGLVNFLLRKATLEGFGAIPRRSETADQEKKIVKELPPESSSEGPLTLQEWKRVGAIGILFCCAVLFWSIYEQGGTSLNLFADKMTDCTFFGWRYPSSWFQSYQAVFVIMLAPFFSWLWLRLGDKEPSSPTKFALGVFFLGLGITLMVPASILAQHGKVSAIWLILCYFLQVVGELCLSPVGLSTVTKLAPVRFLSMTMGFWFLANAIANYLSGYLGGFFNQHDQMSLIYLFGGMGAAAFVATFTMFLLTPTVRRLMSGIH